ncbi:serine O-acetyltransferase [Methanococcus maripaludis]|uniref:Serine O-acetyltransferase n=1 Tax=Methanococcus maripaludis TaxID=39152 RepID=A0A7J9S296_METMI|nr:hypothetical protein [Methanococcus maripaludis]MBB6400912.1 serine O-acetyltransferase [Methanococcus maripaludis]
MWKKLYNIITLNPNYYMGILRVYPKNNVFKKGILHLVTSLNKILLSWEIPLNNTKISCRFAHSIGIVLSEIAKIEEGTLIYQNTTIGANFENVNAPVIGQNCILGANCNIIGDTLIKNNVKIGAGCNIAKSIIEENTKIGMGVVIVNSKIGKNCKIISGSVIHGMTIPDNHMVQPKNGQIVRLSNDGTTAEKK